MDRESLSHGNKPVPKVAKKLPNPRKWFVPKEIRTPVLALKGFTHWVLLGFCDLATFLQNTRKHPGFSHFSECFS